jgi:hypothetical protein
MRVFYIYFVSNFSRQFINILIILLMLKISCLNAHLFVCNVSDQ